MTFCGDVVREGDPDLFLLSMFVPAQVRELLWALFAFQVEISKTRSVVSEQALGLIRLQWWRDEISQIYGTGQDYVPGHQILAPLANAIRDYDLPQEDFETLLEAREFDLEDILPENLDGFLNYLSLTHEPLMRLALLICGRDLEMEPVYPVSMNFALVRALRSLPRTAEEGGRFVLPQDLLARYGVRVEDALAGRCRESLSLAVEELAGQFVSDLKSSCPLLRSMDVLARLYMGQIRACKYDIFAPRMEIDPAFKVLRLTLFTKFISF